MQHGILLPHHATSHLFVPSSYKKDTILALWTREVTGSGPSNLTEVLCFLCVFFDVTFPRYEVFFPFPLKS